MYGQGKKMFLIARKSKIYVDNYDSYDQVEHESVVIAYCEANSSEDFLIFNVPSMPKCDNLS